MRRASLICVSSAVLILACSRARPTPPSSGTPAPAQSSSEASVESGSKSTPAPEEQSPDIPYSKDKRLSYAGYEITVERKRVKVEEFNAENEVAVLKKNGRIIAAFDAVRHPLGAFTRLALVPVLGDQNKQLVIEQTGPREWANWVIALEPRFRVVFTNSNYPVDHELRVADLDGDGTPELLQTLNTFWFFDGLCGACSPRFDVAFKYDRKRGVFLPANHILNGFCESADKLEKSEQSIKLWQGENPDLGSNPIKASELYSKVLIHALPLLYCGSENLGWSFFDRLYNLPDGEIRKSRIKRILRRDRVYRVIQNDLKRTHRDASLHRARVPR